MRSAVKLALALGALLAIPPQNFAIATTQVIEVHARRYAFSPAEINVTKGQPVELKLVSDDVAHSLLVRDLGINKVVTRNKPAVVTFTAEHSGTFVGVCGRFCGEGHGRMSFTIRVTEH